MSEPTIQDAKDLAYKHRKRGVIILAFTDTGYSSASYGMTRKDCDAMKKANELITSDIQAGVIPIWE